MRCETFHAQIGPWLDDKLDASTAGSFLAHSMSCADCRELQRARSLLRSIIVTSNRDERLSPLITDLLDSAKSRKLR